MYRARIVNFRTDWDRLRDGRPYTFLVETDPPGFESYVSWFASTLHGSASPELGRGPSFTVQFERTWGESRWLGVQADNAYFNLDAKIPILRSVAPSHFTEGDVVTIEGDHLPPNYFDMDLNVLLLTDSSSVSIDVTEVFNLDEDPEGERIVGQVGPVPDAVVAEPATLVLLNCAGEPFDVPSTLTITDDRDRSLAVPPIANAVILQRSDTDGDTSRGGVTVTDPPPGQFIDFRAVGDDLNDRIDVSLAGMTWAASTQYILRGGFYALHLNGTELFYCGWSFEKDVTFTTDATPTTSECAVAIAGKFQALIAGANTPGGTYCEDNFECVANGTTVRLQKRAGSLVNLILGDFTTHSYGVVAVKVGGS